jgi:hypothetical protein
MNQNYLDSIADAWRERAPELASWTMLRLVNRTDVWGRYLKPQHRESLSGKTNNAITAPFREERGKVFLDLESLQKHFRARDGGGVLGVHSTSSDGACRWFAIDIDLHDEEDNLSVTREGNFAAAKNWLTRLAGLGLDPILLDSNGKGGFHVWVVFEQPLENASVYRFARELVADYERLGLDTLPEIFPGEYRYGHYGSWLRLPGRHHTRPHFTKVWNDEPWADEPWLAGHEAIDRMLSVRGAALDVCEKLGLRAHRRTVCLDFDGVIHSYQSGWQGETVITDPPIHRVDRAIAQLRKIYRIVVYSARCRTPEGVQAIRDWLARHKIEVDDVCEHKPPAFVYVDDRAIQFTGDWEQTIQDIHQFRK